MRNDASHAYCQLPTRTTIVWASHYRVCNARGKRSRHACRQHNNNCHRNAPRGAGAMCASHRRHQLVPRALLRLSQRLVVRHTTVLLVGKRPQRRHTPRPAAGQGASLGSRALPQSQQTARVSPRSGVSARGWLPSKRTRHKHPTKSTPGLWTKLCGAHSPRDEGQLLALLLRLLRTWLIDRTCIITTFSIVTDDAMMTALAGCCDCVRCATHRCFSTTTVTRAPHGSSRSLYASLCTAHLTRRAGRGFVCL